MILTSMEKWCKTLQAARRAVSPEKIRESKRKYEYGLTPEDFKLMLAVQQNACGICAEPFLKTPNVDHCHGTGKVRGLLCSRCNKGLGHFRDSIEVLDRAKEYLGR